MADYYSILYGGSDKKKEEEDEKPKQNSSSSDYYSILYGSGASSSGIKKEEEKEATTPQAGATAIQTATQEAQPKQSILSKVSSFVKKYTSGSKEDVPSEGILSSVSPKEEKPTFESSNAIFGEPETKSATFESEPERQNTFQEEQAIKADRLKEYAPVINERVSDINNEIKKLENELYQKNQNETIADKILEPLAESLIPFGNPLIRSDSDIQKEIIKLTDQKSKLEKAINNEKIGAGEAFLDGVKSLDMINNVKDIYYSFQAQKKQEKGEELSTKEKIAYNNYIVDSFSDKTFGGKIAGAIPSLAEFGLEFWLTGGIASGVKKGTKESLEKYITSKLGRSIVSGTSFIAGEGARTVFQPTTYLDILRYKAPELSFSENQNGQLIGMLEKNNTSWTAAMLKGFGAGLVNNATESAGILVNKIGTKVSKSAIVQRLKQATLFSFLEKKGVRTFAEAVDEVKKAVGWNGILGEVFEEEIAEPALALIEGRQYDSPITKKGFQRLLEEFAIISVYGGIIGAPAQIENVKNKISEIKDRENIEYTDNENGKIFSLKTEKDQGGHFPFGNIKIGSSDLIIENNDRFPTKKEAKKYGLEIASNFLMDHQPKTPSELIRWSFFNKEIESMGGTPARLTVNPNTDFVSQDKASTEEELNLMKKNILRIQAETTVETRNAMKNPYDTIVSQEESAIRETEELEKIEYEASLSVFDKFVNSARKVGAIEFTKEEVDLTRKNAQEIIEIQNRIDEINKDIEPIEKAVLGNKRIDGGVKESTRRSNKKLLREDINWQELAKERSLLKTKLSKKLNPLNDTLLKSNPKYKADFEKMTKAQKQIDLLMEKVKEQFGGKTRKNYLTAQKKPPAGYYERTSLDWYIIEAREAFGDKKLVETLEGIKKAQEAFNEAKINLFFNYEKIIEQGVAEQKRADQSVDKRGREPDTSNARGDKNSERNAEVKQETIEGKSVPAETPKKEAEKAESIEKKKEVEAMLTKPIEGGKIQTAQPKMFGDEAGTQQDLLSPQEAYDEAVEKSKKIFSSGSSPTIRRNNLEKMLNPEGNKISIEEALTPKKDNVPVGERLQNMADKLYTHLKDEMHPVIKAFGADSRLHDLIRGMAGATKRAEEMLIGEGTFDFNTWEKTGESLSDIVRDMPKEKMETFNNYLVARREELLQETRKDYKTVIDLFSAKAYIKDAEKKYPDMSQLSDRVVAFNDRVLRYAIDSGFMSEEDYDNIKKKDPYYTTPFFRDVENQKGKFLGGVIGKSAISPIKRLKGSLDADLKIMNPIGNIIKNTYHVVDTVNKNEIKQEMVSMMNKNKEFEVFIKKTKPKMIPVGSAEHTAVYDKEFEDSLVSFAKNLGLQDYKVKGKAGKNLGYFTPYSDSIVRRLGTGRETLAHEVGHFLDIKFGLKNHFFRGTLGKEVNAELYQHSTEAGEKGKRLNSKDEKFANAFAWWLIHRDLAKEAMPMFDKKMQTIIRAMPQLRPLLNIKPTPKAVLESETETIFGIAPFQPDNTIEVRIDGQREWYEVDPDIYKSLMGLDKASTNILVKILAFPTKLLRAGATLNPSFSIRNPFRDQFTAAINSNNGYIPYVDLVKGLYNLIWSKNPTTKETLRLYRVSGAEYASLSSLDRTSLEKGIKEVIQSKGKTYYIKHPIEFLRVVSEYGETATRFQEAYRVMQKRGLTKEGALKAGAEARDLTVNFGRIGATGKVWNQLVAFFNAQLEGMDKMIRQHKKHPIKTVSKSFAYVTVPSIILWFINRDNEEYKELPQWRKDLFWNIPRPDGGFFAIPKPFDYGLIYGSLPERILDSMDQGSAKKGFDDFSDTLFRGFVPSMVPTAAVPPLENWANRSTFLDRAIVPEWKEGLEGELQYDRYTSESAKFLGRVFGYSPAKIENFIYGYTASFGKTGLDVADFAISPFTNEPPAPEKKLSQFPIIKSFLIDKPIGSRSQSVSDFYKISDEAEKALSSYKEFQKTSPEKADKYLQENAQMISIARDVSKMRSEMGDMWDKRDLILESMEMSPKEKTKQLDVIDEEISDLASSFLKEIEAMEYSPGIGDFMSLPQTEDEKMAKVFEKLSYSEQEDILSGLSDSHKEALSRGQAKLVAKNYAEKYLKASTSSEKSSITRSFREELSGKLFENGRPETSGEKQQLAYYEKLLNIYGTFGQDDQTVNAIMSVNSNEEKVKILLEQKASMGNLAFETFFRKGLRSGLISDELKIQYRKAIKDLL